MLTKLKSFLKAIWGNIWPTAELRKVKYMKTSEEYYNLLEKPRQIYKDDKPVRGLIPPRSIMNNLKEPIRGNLVWEKEGVKFIPDKDGKYTKHRICENTHYVKYIPEFDDDYVMGCDPANPESKSEGTFHIANLHGELITNPSPFLKEQLRIAKEKQLAYLKALYYELYELSGDVSEQSVILPKMDRIANSVKIWEWSDWKRYITKRRYDEFKYADMGCCFYSDKINFHPRQGD